ncbi:hypothetical protein RUM44_007086 [Polyplax serrata]|uniref:Uncharacterized protein n=1 Tax=Polyplax serrata TaxID=468196 RepID=A0ABR1AZV8_POLSC
MVKGKGASRLKGNKDKENERECPSTFGKQESKNVPKRTKIIKEKKIRKNGGKETPEEGTAMSRRCRRIRRKKNNGNTENIILMKLQKNRQKK